MFWGYDENDASHTPERTTASGGGLNGHATVVEVCSRGLGHDIDEYLMEGLSTFIDDVTDSHPW